MKGLRKATLTEWCIVRYPDIYNCLDNPAKCFAKFVIDKTQMFTSFVLLGKAKDDPRYNAAQGEDFGDGHTLITSPIIKVEGNKYYTTHTIYTLSKDGMSPEYRKWCLENP